MHDARERALVLCRKVIQTAAKSIRHVHRRQFGEATRFAAEAGALARDARLALEGHPSLVYAGYVHDAEKEWVEALAMIAMAQGSPLPVPEELDVEIATYLNGLGEAASECRRYLLDELRSGNSAEAERLMAQMESVYDVLVTLDYPDALTGGLRRTTDALRAVLERTRGDVTMTLIQSSLMRALGEHQPE